MRVKSRREQYYAYSVITRASIEDGNSWRADALADQDDSAGI